MCEFMAPYSSGSFSEHTELFLSQTVTLKPKWITSTLQMNKNYVPVAPDFRAFRTERIKSGMRVIARMEPIRISRSFSGAMVKD